LGIEQTAVVGWQCEILVPCVDCTKQLAQGRISASASIAQHIILVEPFRNFIPQAVERVGRVAAVHRRQQSAVLGEEYKQQAIEKGQCRASHFAELSFGKGAATRLVRHRFCDGTHQGREHDAENLIAQALGHLGLPFARLPQSFVVEAVARAVRRQERLPPEHEHEDT
jgi:hypothetical protein